MSRETGNSFDAPHYLITSLPSGHRKIYDIIQLYVSKSTKEPYCDNDKRNNERRLFQRFIKPSGEKEDKFKKAFDYFSKSISLKTIKECHKEGMGKPSFDAAFRASAYINTCSVKDRLEEYIKQNYSLRHDNSIFKFVADIVKEIRFGDTKDLIESKELTLQEEELITKKLNGFSKKLGFYPYGKDNLPKKNIPLYERIINEIDIFLDKAYGHHRLLSYKVNLLCILDKIDDALFISASLYQKNNKDLKILGCYSYALGRKGDFKKSLAVAELGLKISPNNISLLTRKAVSLENLGQANASVETYLKLVQLDKDYYFPYYRLGFIYKRIGNYESAKVFFEKALSISPNNNFALIGYQECKRINFLVGAPDNINKENKSLLALFNKAMKYFYGNKNNKAIEIIYKMVEKMNENPLVSDGEKSVYYSAFSFIFLKGVEENGSSKKYLYQVIEYGKKSIAINSKQYQAYISLATAYFLLDEREKSKTYIESASTEEKSKGFLKINGTYLGKYDFYEILFDGLKINFNISDAYTTLFWYLEVNKNSVRCNLILALELFVSDKKIESKKYYLKAIEICKKHIIHKNISPEEIQKHLFIANFLSDKGRLWSENEINYEISEAIINQCHDAGLIKLNRGLWKDLVVNRLDVIEYIYKKNRKIESINKYIDLSKELIEELSRYGEQNEWINVKEKIIQAYDRLWLHHKDCDAFLQSILNRQDLILEIDINTDRAYWIKLQQEIADGFLNFGNERDDPYFYTQSIEESHKLLGVYKNEKNDIACTYFNIATNYLNINILSPNEEHVANQLKMYTNALDVFGNIYLEGIWRNRNALQLRIAKESNNSDALVQGVNDIKERYALLHPEKHIIDRLHCQFSLGFLLLNKGNVDDDYQAYKDSLSAFEIAIDLSKEIDDKVNHMAGLCNIGLLHLQIYEKGFDSNTSVLENGAIFLKQSIDMANLEEPKYAPTFGYSNGLLGDLLYLIGKTNNSKDVLSEAASAYKQSQLYYTKKRNAKQWEGAQEEIDKINKELELIDA